MLPALSIDVPWFLMLRLNWCISKSAVPRLLLFVNLLLAASFCVLIIQGISTPLVAETVAVNLCIDNRIKLCFSNMCQKYSRYDWFYATNLFWASRAQLVQFANIPNKIFVVTLLLLPFAPSEMSTPPPPCPLCSQFMIMQFNCNNMD